jgi:hypothetical protein
VGGGSVPNDTRNSLARIPLRWMIRQCFILQTGIMFHKEMMKTIGVNPDTLWPVVLPRPPMMTTVVNEITAPAVFVDEQREDLLDALSPIYDQLKKVKPWWLLEVLPTKVKVQKEDGSWAGVVSCVSSRLFCFCCDSDCVQRQLWSGARRAETAVSRRQGT